MTGRTTGALFIGEEAGTLLAAAGATIAALAGRGWRCAVACEEATQDALGALGAVRGGAREPADLVIASSGATDLPPDRTLRVGGPLALRVHEGLDAKVAALGAQAGTPLSEDEARRVVEAALRLGRGTGAEGFTPDGPAARARLAELLSR